MHRVPYGFLHITFLVTTGLLGWLATVLFTLWPGDHFRAVRLDWELWVTLLLVIVARPLAFPVYRRMRIALDSTFYFAVAFVFGTLTSAWLMVIALTIDGIIRLSRGVGLAVRGESPSRYVGALVLHLGGLPALVIVGVGFVFGDATLLPHDDLTTMWKLPAFAVSFLLPYYFLAGGTQWFEGSTHRQLAKEYLPRVVFAELILIPLSLAMVFSFVHRGIGLFWLLGATGLLFNAIFRRGSIAAEELRQRVDELSTLNKVGAILAGSLERDTLLKNVAKETNQLMGFRSQFMIGVLNEHGDKMLFEVFNEEGQRYEQFETPVGAGLTGWIMRNRKPLRLGDVQTEWRLYLENLKHNDPRYHAWLGVPMTIYDEVIGVMSVQSENRYTYTPAHQRVLSTIADQAAVALENARLYELATVDGLTGLFVRRYFDMRAEEEWRRSERYKNPFCVVMLDLDNFKKLNDTYGHQTGDRVLRQAAHVVRDNMRSFDIAARYGGEEFAVVLPRTGPEEARIVAERVRQDVADMSVQADGVDLKVTASIGLASFPTADVRSVSELVALADAALYTAKSRGKNCVVVSGDEPAEARESAS